MPRKNQVRKKTANKRMKMKPKMRKSKNSKKKSRRKSKKMSGGSAPFVLFSNYDLIRINQTIEELNTYLTNDANKNDVKKFLEDTSNKERYNSFKELIEQYSYNIRGGLEGKFGLGLEYEVFLYGLEVQIKKYIDSNFEQIKKFFKERMDKPIDVIVSEYDKQFTGEIPLSRFMFIVVFLEKLEKEGIKDVYKFTYDDFLKYRKNFFNIYYDGTGNITGSNNTIHWHRTLGIHKVPTDNGDTVNYLQHNPQIIKLYNITDEIIYELLFDFYIHFQEGEINKKLKEYASEDDIKNKIINEIMAQFHKYLFFLKKSYAIKIVESKFTQSFQTRINEYISQKIQKN
tara:strand:- start:1189 stop:2217 length:1029 start_codon:yes stop_codon:yes gene_type:complete